MTTPRQVFFNADANFLVPLQVVVHSLLETIDRSRPLVVHIAHDADFARTDGEALLRKIAAPHPFAELRFHDFSPVFERHRAELDFPGCQWPPMIWAFPLFPELVPDLTGTVVYLDVDMLICRDISPLFELDLAARGYLAAAVDEVPHETAIRLEKIGWPKDAGGYFNNGVLVVDADAYRREKIAERLVPWYGENRKDVYFVEQDAENVFLGARTLRLPMKWNYYDAWLLRSRKLDIRAERWDTFRPRDVLEAIVDPCIVHYMNVHKPWKFTHRPEASRYRRAMREIGLGLEPLPGETPLRRLENVFTEAYHSTLKRFIFRKLCCLRLQTANAKSC